MNTIWLAVALALCVSCAAPVGSIAAQQQAVSAATVAKAAADSQEGWADVSELDGETRDFYLKEVYQLPEGSWSDAAIYAATGVDAREIAVVRLSGADEEETVRDALKRYKYEREGAFVGYAPQQADLVSVGLVRREDDWVALLVCWDAFGAWNAALEAVGKEPVSVPEVTKTPADTRGWTVFKAPNVHDMSLYDTSKILEKWENRGQNGTPELSEKDATLYEKCEQVMKKCVTENMTDFEKELALHDWLADNCVYDQSVYDYETPDGQPGSLEPYGPIVNGTGICLGYATAFQLLMDLAGVECMTVVGASAGSTQDHAWNMVRLEGEWYCVDLTWDDPTSYSGSMTFQQARHRYFNVTSDHMRQTNHQWDYQNVPETTATRFRWDGTGALPK